MDDASVSITLLLTDPTTQRLVNTWGTVAQAVTRIMVAATLGTPATLIGTAILVAAATVTRIVTRTDATAVTGVIVEALLPPEVVATPPITGEDAATQEVRRGVPRPVPADMMPLPVATLDATKVVRLHRTFILRALYASFVMRS